MAKRRNAKRSVAPQQNKPEGLTDRQAVQYQRDATGAGKDLTAVDTPPKLDLEEGSLYAWGDELIASWLPYGDGSTSVFDEDEFLSRDYEEMLKRDGKARAIEQVLTLPIRSATWKIVPGDGDTGEAKFVEDALTRPANAGGMTTPMRLIIAQALSARTHKKACFEKVFTEVDGKIVYKKLAFRPASTTGIMRDSKSGAFRGFRQRPVPIGGMLGQTGQPWVEIPAQYAWVHLNNQHVNAATGHSDMELIYWLHNQKNKILFLWATFLEVQATGRYVVHAQDESTAQKYARAIRGMKNGGVLGASGEMPVTVEPLEVGSQGGALFKAFLDYCDQMMAESVLAGFLNLTGSADHGSYALSSDSSDFFLQSLNATAKELEESITNWVVADLVTLNFGDKGVCPKFEFGTLSEKDLTAIKDTLVSLATSVADPRVPQAFINELVKSTANYLGLSTEEIEKGFKEVEDRLKEKADLEMQGKKAGLEMQKMSIQSGNPIAGAAARKNSDMITTGAKVGAATQMVKQKQAAQAAKANTTQKG